MKAVLIERLTANVVIDPRLLDVSRAIETRPMLSLTDAEKTDCIRRRLSAQTLKGEITFDSPCRPGS